MNYYEILPLTTTGAADMFFTYESEIDIQPGALTSIPLRNRKVKGMVIKKVSKPKFDTKPVTKILSEEPVLNKYQLEIADKISEYYLSGLGDIISCILPFEFGKRRRQTVVVNKNIQGSEQPLKMTDEQKDAFETIKNGKSGSKYLLHGVTGSGKTEVYLQLAAEGLKKDQGSIILIPEISLTPQTKARFEKRFKDKVAVWHSGLKETEKYHTWQMIKNGEKKVVLGARSAIFTPVKNLGYIFIDEEHETSYKQDQNPRYEAGMVAEWLSKLTGAKLVLGSATPSVESFWESQNGKSTLLPMNNRIIQESMPPVKIIDLRVEFQKGNKSIFSDELYDAAKKALKKNQQVLLFVNRRGASTFVVCRDCGFVMECPHCEIPLTYHPSEGEKLNCHHCGYSRDVPSVCPNCKSYAIRYFGLGTQKVEIEARKMFPNAKIARMDRDTTTKRGSHEAIYEGFANQDFDILIGTQLIAKGWDLPNVAVVGIISADTMLNIPDYRSSERTFDILTQVAGRTGRGYQPGEVVIQTYSPDNYAIKAAANHNFKEFYDQEISERKKYEYPPFSKLIKLTIAQRDAGIAEKKADGLAEMLGKAQIEGITILGPNPAFIEKLAGKYRWQIVIKKQKSFNNTQAEVLNKILYQVIKDGWTVDIDPDSLL